MTRSLRWLIAFLLPVLCCGCARGWAAEGRTLWVEAGTAIGVADGSPQKPFSLASAALKAAKPGDSVVLRAGVYREQLILPSGAPGAPLTLKAEPGARVVISGFEPITGWQPFKENVFVTSLNWKPNDLYVNFTGQPMSREPNEGWYRIETSDGKTLGDKAHLANRADNLVGGLVQFHQRAGNVFFTFPIGSIDAAGSVTMMHNNQWAKAQPGDRYSLRNRAALIDRPGEWAVEAAADGKNYQLYFWPRHAADLKSTQARRLDRRLIFVNDAKNVRIEGLEITGGTGHGVEVNKSSDVTITRCIAHNNGNTGFWLRGVSAVTIARCLSLHNVNGITLASARNATIEENEVGFNLIDGINVTGDISGRYGKPEADANAITSDITVRRNYVHHHLLWGHPDNFQLYRGVKNVRYIENLSLGSGQGLMSEEVDGGELIGNVFLSSSAYLIIFGHNNSHNWTIRRNTFGFPGYGIYNFTGQNYDARENIYLGTVQTPADYKGDYNLYGAAFSAKAPGQDEHSLKADPQLVSVPISHSAIGDAGASTAESLILRRPEGFKAGDHIEVNWDGVVRRITAVDGKKITFKPALPVAPNSDYVVVANWGEKTQFVLDTRLKPDSPGAKLANGAPAGSPINVPAYRMGDFDSDGRRDLPALPDDVKAGLPDPNNLLLPTS